MAKPYQLPSLANGTEGFHGTHKTLDLAPHVLIYHVFQYEKQNSFIVTFI